MAIKTNHSKESLTPDSGVLKIDGTGALALPAGAESNRPVVSAAGYVRFDSDITKPEFFDGSNWQTITDKEYVDNAILSTNNKVDSLNLNSLTDVNVTNPADGQVISYDATLGLFRSSTNAFSAVTKLFTADGSTLEFDLQTSVFSVNNLVVSINGIQQEPFFSFNLIDGHLLAFDEAPEQNDRISVRILKSTVTSDRPRPKIVNIYYGTVSNYSTITIVATDITYGTTVKIGGKSVSRIDYPTPDSMQVMIETSLMGTPFWNQPQDLTIVDTSGNEFNFAGLIKYGIGTPYWLDSTSYIGTFSGGDSIIFPIRVNNATSMTIGPAYDGEATVSWLSISGTNLVGTAPQNSSPSRYEVKITANTGSVYITKNYWLLVI
jgi:hypothetical protein